MGPGVEFEEVQLLIDEWPSARDAVTRKLAEMDTDRGAFSFMAYAAMFRVLRGSGDRETEPLLRKYLDDPDKRVVHYAKIAYGNVVKGIRFQYCAGY